MLRALAVLLVLLHVAAASSSLYAAFDGAQALDTPAATHLFRAASSSSSPTDVVVLKPVAATASATSAGFDLFHQPLRRVALVFAGLDAAEDKSLLVNGSSAALVGGHLAVETLPLPSALPTMDGLHVDDVSALLSEAGVKDVSYDRASHAVVFDGAVFLTVGDKANRKVLNELVALARLADTLPTTGNVSFSFSGLKALIRRLGGRTDEYETVRAVYGQLITSFLEKTGARTLTYVAVVDDSRSTTEMTREQASFVQSNLRVKAASGAAVQTPPTWRVNNYQLGIWTMIVLFVVMLAFTINTCNMSTSKDSYSRELYRDEM